MRPSLRLVIGWTAVGGSVLIACFWAFWGGNEAFFEGWYAPSVFANVALALVQYLSPMVLFVAVAVASVTWRVVGVALHLGLAVFALFFFRVGAGRYLIALLLVLLASGYWAGRPQPQRTARRLVVTLPVLTAVVCGAGPAWRVAHRVDDGNYGVRRVAGNGVELTWAPAGPGWPDSGATWFDAARTCRYLKPDGKTPAPAPQEIWRLPTAEESVRSLVRQGRNAGGFLDPTVQMKARYAIAPDKETPLWNPHSMIIYWWTSTEVNSTRALRVSYNGWVTELPKTAREGYLAYRCVRP
jgi:hypothetical protein